VCECVSSYDVTTFILYSTVSFVRSFRIRWFNIYIYIHRKIIYFLYVHLKVQDQFGKVSSGNFVLIGLLSYQHHNLKLIVTKMLQYVGTSKSRILHILHPVERPVPVNECCLLLLLLLLLLFGNRNIIS
jgi:hypothetical protein